MSHDTSVFPLDVELLEAVIDHLPIGAILLDDEGTIQRFNRHEEQLSGFRRETVLGKSFFGEVAPCTDDIELGPRFREGIEANNLDLDVEFSFPYPYNRVPRDVRIRARTVGSSRHHAHVILIEDITSRRQLERNNAEMMTGLKSMIARWRGDQQQNSSALANRPTGHRPFEREAVALYLRMNGLNALASQTPPAELFHVVDCQLQLALEIIQRSEGHIDELTGQSVLATFSVDEQGPEGYENGLNAASQIVAASSSVLDLPFQIGLSSGAIYQGPIGATHLNCGTTVGAPISRARVLAEEARPREILVTEDIVDRGAALTSTTCLPDVKPDRIDYSGSIYRVDNVASSKNPE